MQDELGPSIGPFIQSVVDRTVNVAVKQIAASVSCLYYPGSNTHFFFTGQTLWSLPQGTMPSKGQEAPSQNGINHHGPQTKETGPCRRKHLVSRRQAWTLSAPRGKEAARQRESGSGCWQREGREGQTEGPVTCTTGIADHYLDTAHPVVYCNTCINVKMASCMYPQYWTMA